MDNNTPIFLIRLSKEETAEKQRQENNTAEAERLRIKVSTLTADLRQAEHAITERRQSAEKITMDAAIAAGKELALADEIETRLPRLRNRLSEAEREYGEASLKLPKANRSHLFTKSILGLS